MHRNECIPFVGLPNRTHQNRSLSGTQNFCSDPNPNPKPFSGYQLKQLLIIHLKALESLLSVLNNPK